MSKVLLLSGSPRDGNTNFVFKKIYESIQWEKELIFLKDLEIKHCIGCLNCYHNYKCVIKDDMDQVLKKMCEADILIIGSPNYFDNVSGLLKDFIDRTHPLYKAELLKGKKLFLIMVGGGKAEGTQKYLNETTFGFVKYQKLDLVNSYCFQAWEKNEIAKNDSLTESVDEIIKEISLQTN